MKHAVLIMAHKNKEQLIRLINAISCPDFDIFVHPDLQWNLSFEDLCDIENCAENVYMCSKRIHGELDKWSLPQIALNLIDDALKNGKLKGVDYSYFLLLSGQDYPIKSKRYILDFLEQQFPMPLIHVDRYEKELWVRTKFMLVRWTHKIEEIHKTMKPGILRKLRVLPYVLTDMIERKVYRTPYDRLKKYKLNLYGGSAWWILPKGVIDFISQLQREKPGLIKEYARTWTPEETFFKQ